MMGLAQRLDMRRQTALQYTVFGRYKMVRKNEFQGVWEECKNTDEYQPMQHLHAIMKCLKCTVKSRKKSSQVKLFKYCTGWAP